MAISFKLITLIQSLLYTFCVNWYQTSSEKDDITFSTYSMFVAFSLLYIGSDGNTKKQLGEVFGFSKINEIEFDDAILSLVEHDSKAKEVIVQISNGIWLDKNIMFKEEYKKHVEKLKCEIRNADFRHFPEDGRQEINKYIENATRNVIVDFLKPGSITSDTVSVIVNAIYFKGEWKTEFDLMKEPFLFDNKQQEVVGMEKEKLETSAVFDELYTAVNIPYKDNGYSMVIIMPENMKKFEKKYMNKKDKESKLKDIVNDVRKRYPENRKVKLPKFKIETSISMNKQLKKLGVKEAFTENANFNKITPTQIYISEALHKCVVEVDEKGSEAAAVTVVIMNGIFSCADCFFNEPPPPRPVIIDKPFFFFIVGGEMEVPLFFGKISHPTI